MSFVELTVNGKGCFFNTDLIGVVTPSEDPDVSCVCMAGDNQEFWTVKGSVEEVMGKITSANTLTVVEPPKNEIRLKFPDVSLRHPPLP